MAYRAKVLQVKAEKFELKKLEVLKVNKEQVSALEPLLQDVYANRRPKTMDYQVRRDLIRVFNVIAEELYGNSKDIPVVVEFGSFVMDLFSITSDLDLSVNFNATTVPFPREKKIQTLRKFAKKLYALQSSGHVSGVLPITTAKVPILKCVDLGTGVECDISVENRDGILKSQLIHIISSIDERFHKLSFLMKNWAKAHNINSSKDKTLNSLSLILLVAFHLQTRNPPILPPFSALFKDGTGPATVLKSVSNFVNYGKGNTESLAELFVTLLIKLSSVEKLWAKGLCASTCNASWISKTWDSKVAPISVEDFTDQSQNVSRAVGHAERKQIYKCVNISIQYIFSFMDGKIGVELRDVLFGQDGKPTPNARGALLMNPIESLPCAPHVNQTRKVNGKRTKPDMRTKSAPDEQASTSAKKMRTGRVLTVMRNGNQLGTQHVTNFDPRRGQQAGAGGWGETLRPSARGWGETQQPGAGGWGEAHRPGPGGWGEAHQPAAGGGWGEAHRPGPGGWGEAHRPAAGGGWGEAHRPAAGGGWGEAHRPAAGGGWGEAHRPAAGGDWGEAQQSSAGGQGGSWHHSAGRWVATQPSSAGGWGETQRSSGGGWGGGQPSNAGGWGGAQPFNAGGWGGTSSGLWRGGRSF